MKKYYLILALLVFFGFAGNAQNTFPPVSVATGTFLGETIPLRDFETVTVSEGIPETVREVPLHHRTQGRLNPNALPVGPDPLLQQSSNFTTESVIGVNFDGAGINEGQALPPDPSGAVGPNHYVHAVNLVVKIFDKAGNLLAGPTPLGTFLGSGNNSGDPIVMYDQLADRYFVSQFRISNNALIIGVSSSPDPTGSYFLYQFPLNAFPDYPHYSVWPNAYFLTANKAAQTTYALDREALIAGESDPQIIGFFLPSNIPNPNTVFSPEPANLLGDTYPADVPGYIVYLQDDTWSSGITFDHLKIWEIDLDWENGGSTISSPVLIPTAPFDSVLFPFGTGDVSQPGTSQRLDGINGVISYMANYRSFPTHNSFLVNFNVDIGSNTLGVRWIELRSVGTGPFTIFQEGTWSLPDGESRFMGSMGMDESGNIGLAYNVGSASNNVDLRHTGRLSTDPPGVMTVPETTIVNGGGIQTNTNRFGDYAQMTMDIDNRSFWHTGQYFSSNNFWKTRIASFKLVPDLTNDVGVYNFVTPYFAPYSDNEIVEVSLYNFGTASQSNFDIELKLDGNVVATETFTGTIAPGTSATYTFSQTVDLGTVNQTYVLEATTLLGSDEYIENDNFIKTITNEEILAANENSFPQESLMIYPVNDKTYEIMLSSTSDLGDMRFNLYNIGGQQLITGALERNSKGYVSRVDMSAFASGVYLVEVTNGKKSLTKRILMK